MAVPHEIYDYSYYRDTELDTAKFCLAAIEDFAQKYIGFPDIVYLEFWRRITTLPHEQWNIIYHGAVKIAVKTPQDNDVHLMFEGLYLPPDVAICVRKKAPTPQSFIQPVPTLGVTNDVNVAH